MNNSMRNQKLVLTNVIILFVGAFVLPPIFELMHAMLYRSMGWKSSSLIGSVLEIAVYGVLVVVVVGMILKVKFAKKHHGAIFLIGALAFTVVKTLSGWVLDLINAGMYYSGLGSAIEFYFDGYFNGVVYSILGTVAALIFNLFIYCSLAMFVCYALKKDR